VLGGVWAMRWQEAVAPVMDTYELAEPKDVLAALSKAVVGEAGPFWKGACQPRRLLFVNDF
jgi:hypothetical protein